MISNHVFHTTRLMSLVLLCGVAGGARAQSGPKPPPVRQNLLKPNQYTLTATPIDIFGGIHTAAVGTIYDSSAGPSAGGTTSTTSVVSQYNSISPDPLNALTKQVFVGGVATANDVLFFDFYDTATNFVGSYGVSLPQAGNFVWTVTIDDPQSVLVPNAGYSVMAADNGTNNVSGMPSTVTFRYQTAAPAIGTTPDALVYRQALTTVNATPAPSSLIVFALGGLGLLSRRKAVRK